LRIVRFAMKDTVLNRLGDDVLYVRMDVYLELMEDVSDSRTHHR